MKDDYEQHRFTLGPRCREWKSKTLLTHSGGTELETRNCTMR